MIAQDSSGDPLCNRQKKVHPFCVDKKVKEQERKQKESRKHGVFREGFNIFNIPMFSSKHTVSMPFIENTGMWPVVNDSPRYGTVGAAEIAECLNL